ncbi:hypothetical protein SH661x_003133 [Planctomicrobium sp. SH661]|uniref:hypothetical protein n=1 Tax=Planctomicrobium sp. SH661 TaxID=3448124 RepID=UPI003F5B752A
MKQTYIAVVVAGALAFAGCGGGDQAGARRYEVEGTVTYDGKAVPYGDISFEPDTAKGSSGPAGVGVIQNGVYKLDKSSGPVAGPLKVRIIGFDGIAPQGPSTMPHGQPLFETRWEQVEQPENKAVHNFDLTSTQSKK